MQSTDHAVQTPDSSEAMASYDVALVEPTNTLFEPTFGVLKQIFSYFIVCPI